VAIQTNQFVICARQAENCGVLDVEMYDFASWLLTRFGRSLVEAKHITHTAVCHAPEKIRSAGERDAGTSPAVLQK